MQPCMSEAELQLFKYFTSCSSSYLEFGSGGSTCLAANSVRTSVLSVDSSKIWQDDVARYCSDNVVRVPPRLCYVDIGPTGEWGYPTDESTIDRWPNYHSQIWSETSASGADLFLVDGRFRVACVMQILLNCEADALIMMHDFASRPQYHVVKDVAREIARSGNLAVFQSKNSRNRFRIMEILRDHKVEPG